MHTLSSLATLHHLSVCQPNGPYSNGKHIVNCSATVTASKGNYMLSISVQGDVISFTVSAPTTGWVGIGFSLDQSMVRPMNGKCIWIVFCNNQRSYDIDLFTVQLNTDTIIGAHDTSSGEVLLYDGSVRPLACTHSYMCTNGACFSTLWILPSGLWCIMYLSMEVIVCHLVSH